MGLIGQIIQKNLLSPERIHSNPLLAGAALLGLSLSRILTAYESDSFTSHSRIVERSIVDPYSCETYSYSSQDELNEIRGKIEESRVNYNKEKLRQDLRLASGGSPEQVESIYQNTSPVKRGKSLVEDSSSRYYQEMSNAVVDAVLASASTMSLDELRKYAAKYPGLHSTLIFKEAEIARKEIAISRISAEKMRFSDKLDVEV